MTQYFSALAGVFLGMTTSFVPFLAHADEALPPDSRLQDVATITNTRDPSTGVVSIVLDAKENVLGVYEVHSLNDGSGTVTKMMLTVEQIKSSQGAVLYEEMGMNIFFLRGFLDSEHGKAALEIRYLTNGILGSYDSCKINAVRSPQGTWSLVNAYDGKLVTEIHARAWKLGIRTIENVCPGTR